VSEALSTSCDVRPGGSEDVEFIRDMLYEAACWRPDASRPPRDEVLSAPRNAIYVDDWGRPGDAAVVAQARTDGRKIGAAWYRLMLPKDPGYGFVNAATPELSLGVVSESRGRGVGGALLKALIRTAKSQGFRTLSLGVEKDNPALQIYERHGFVRLFDTGGAWTMKADLSSNPGSLPERPSRLCVLDGHLSVCRLHPESEVPEWAVTGDLFSVTRTRDELSVVCPEAEVPGGVRSEGGWRVLELEGPFEFSEVGVLASVAAPLAEAGVGIFAMSTFDTDYVLVKEKQLESAVAALRGRGHEVSLTLISPKEETC
jgi:GNAT superfamily N-acetyltransferase